MLTGRLFFVRASVDAIDGNGLWFACNQTDKPVRPSVLVVCAAKSKCLIVDATHIILLPFFGQCRDEMAHLIGLRGVQSAGRLLAARGLPALLALLLVHLPLTIFLIEAHVHGRGLVGFNMQ